MPQKRKEMAGLIFGDLLVLNESNLIRAKTCSWLEWKTKCIKCGCEEWRSGKNLRNSKRVPTCKKCSLSKKMSINGKKLRTGTKNISGSYWCELKRSAVKRGYGFSISIKYAQELLEAQNFKCALSDTLLIMDINNSFYLTGKNGMNTGSVDRIDSSKGYIKGNVQWVHRDINFMKQAYSQEYYIEMCRKVANAN